MAGAAHLGVALAAKRVAPRMPLWALVLSSYAIDLLFMAFMLAGKERMPSRVGHESPVEPAKQSTNPWSHGLAMALIWTSLSGLIAGRVSRHRHSGLLISSLVFSHWLVDFVSKPMTAVFPQDTGLPLLFEGSPTVGLGLYRSKRVANAVEYGSLAVGATLYLQTVASGGGRRTETSSDPGPSLRATRPSAKRGTRAAPALSLQRRDGVGR
jgi:hypothetical protein